MRTPPHPGPPALVVVLASLLLSCVPLLQVVSEVAEEKTIVATGLVSAAWTGTSRAAVEADLEEDSWFARVARLVWAPAVDTWLRRGNSRVRFGVGDWLFYREGVQFVTSPAFDGRRVRRLLGLEPDANRPLAAILDFARQLQKRGVVLVVVPVPTKATLHPDALDPDLPVDLFPRNPATASFLSDLEAAGVTVVDPSPALLALRRRGRRAFLERDTHWTPEAAETAASVVAEEVLQLPAAAGLEEGRTPFDHRRITFRGRGDVAAMLPWSPEPRLFADHRLELQQVVGTPEGRPPIGDRQSPILLLGDSLTSVFSDVDLGMGHGGGFAEHLAEALGRPLDVIAMPAGGANAARRALALRASPLAGKKIVIWQMTVRDLLFAKEGWQRVVIPPDRELEEVEDRTQVHEVVARVVGVTELPRASDYADCLAIVKYKLEGGDLPGLPTEGERHFFVAQWGFRDFERTEVADYRFRHLNALRLQRLPPDLRLESTCWIDTVGLDEEPWFALEARPQ